MRSQVTNAASAPGLSWNQACGLMGTNKTQTAMGHSLAREGHRSSASGAGHTAVTGAKPQPTGREHNSSNHSLSSSLATDTGSI